MRQHHDLKSIPDHFQPSTEGRKTFEIRKDDRNFQVGDTVTLHEYCYDYYTGRQVSGRISYIDRFAQQEGYVVFALEWIGMWIVQ
ncbi:DUF3850 domain-containing protein [Nitrosovibrio sp. Nv4]|uniref:DUF3850 domain-containing protein n=1 Tax=Nitrosovibrio sp. Nv4 TaxID=1945880 RepID=UPI000BC8B764|nr:DUF3850 domain-containing protein [Nitrosovibrio sp. Nv4]SOD42430.1 protein of unknown function [Nitrosovibrio sp. Nv4]